MARTRRSRTSESPENEGSSSTTIVPPGSASAEISGEVVTDQPTEASAEEANEAALKAAIESAARDAAKAAVESVGRELDGVRSLANELTQVLEQSIQRAQQVDELTTETTSQLLVLLTAVRPLQTGSSAEPPQPSSIDEHIEDMIDPEFGLQPARQAIIAAGQRLLRGYEAFHFPRPSATATPPAETDDD